MITSGIHIYSSLSNVFSRYASIFSFFPLSLFFYAFSHIFSSALFSSSMSLPFSFFPFFLSSHLPFLLTAACLSVFLSLSQVPIPPPSLLRPLSFLLLSASLSSPSSLSLSPLTYPVFCQKPNWNRMRLNKQNPRIMNRVRAEYLTLTQSPKPVRPLSMKRDEWKQDTRSPDFRWDLRKLRIRRFPRLQRVAYLHVTRNRKCELFSCPAPDVIPTSKNHSRRKRENKKRRRRRRRWWRRGGGGGGCGKRGEEEDGKRGSRECHSSLCPFACILRNSSLHLVISFGI